MPKSQTKAIRVAIRNGDDTKVKVSFFGGVFSPQEFTACFMAVLEAYTEGLLQTNARVDVYDHWNSAFGMFLRKILPEESVYERDGAHKRVKEEVDSTLGAEFDPEDSARIRAAAYILAEDVLVKQAGLTKESAEYMLNVRMGTLKAPKGNKGGEA